MVNATVFNVEGADVEGFYRHDGCADHVSGMAENSDVTAKVGTNGTMTLCKHNGPNPFTIFHITRVETAVVVDVGPGNTRLP